MDFVALIVQLLVLNLLLNAFFVPLFQRLDRSVFHRAYFMAFVGAGVPALILSDVISRIPFLGPFLGYSVWGVMAPLFATGPLWQALLGAALLSVAMIGVSYLVFAALAKLLGDGIESSLIASFGIIGAFWLAYFLVGQGVRLAGLPEPGAAGLAVFTDALLTAGRAGLREMAGQPWLPTTLAVVVGGALSWRRPQPLRSWLVLGLAVAVGLHSAGLLYRRTELALPAIVAGVFVFELCYPRLAGLLLASNRIAQVLYDLVPRVIFGPLIAVVALVTVSNPEYAALAAYGGIVLIEWLWRGVVARLAPQVPLKVRVARAELWGDPGLVRQRRIELRAARLVEHRTVLKRAEQQRKGGNRRAAERGYRAIIGQLQTVRQRVEAERELLGLAHLGRGKLRWEANRRGALEDLEQARHCGVNDDEARWLVAPVWAAERRTDEEAIETYLSAIRAGRAQTLPAANDAVVAHLEALCRIDETTAAPQLQQAIALNQRVVQADDTIAWAHYHLGMGSLTLHKPEAAVKQLVRARDLALERPELLYQLGRAYALAGQPRKAATALNEALKRQPEHAPTLFLLGKLAAAPLLRPPPADVTRGSAGLSWQKACTLLENALARVRPHIPADYHFELGRLYALHPARQAEALDALRAAIAADGGQAAYYTQLAAVLRRAARFNEAFDALQQALKRDPKLADVHVLLGEIALERHQFAQAEQHFRNALTLEPPNDAAHHGLGRAHYELDRFREALAEFNRVQSPTAENLFFRARASARLEQFGDALRWLNARLQQFGDDADTHYYLGCAHAHLGDYDAALVHLERAQAMDARRADVLVQRGHVLLQRGDEPAALESYLRARTVEPRSVEAHYALGRFYQQKERLQEAIQSYERARALDATHAPAARALGALLEQQQQSDGAIGAYRAALAIDEAHGWVHHRLGGLLYSAGQYADAVHHLQCAGTLGDESDQLYFYLGLAHTRLEQYDQALSAWQTLLARRPSDARVRTNTAYANYHLGAQAFAAGNYAAAVEHWEHVRSHFAQNLKIKAALAEAYFRLGVAELQQNEQPPDAAQRSFEAAMELHDMPSATRYQYYRSVALLRGDASPAAVEQATQAFVAILAADQAHAGANLQLGLVHWRQYLQSGAAEELRHAIELLRVAGEVEPAARLALAVALASAAQWAAAADVLTKSWPMVAVNARYPLADTARLLTWCLIRAHGPAAAATVLNRLRTSADHPALLMSEAVLDAQGGDLATSITKLERSLSETGDAGVRDVLQRMLCHQAALDGRSGDWAGAAAHLRHAVALG
jgi:tetratricopeptide (TPR) repeat protein